MTINPFLNSDRQLCNDWWILIFFLAIAAFLIPMIVLVQKNNKVVPLGGQALNLTGNA